MKATTRRQVPWEHSALTAPFYFTAPKAMEPAALDQQMELSFWDTVKDSSSPDVLRTYLDRYPQGAFASLAGALIEQHKQRLQAESAAREKEARRQEEERKAAEIRRLEEEKHKRETSLAEAAKRAQEKRDGQELERLQERSRVEEAALADQLRKALEEVRVAREAARVAEENRLAALKAAEEARAAAEKAKEASRSRAEAPDDERVRPAAMQKLPDPSSVGAGPFDGAWTVTRVGEGRCGRGRVYTFKVYIWHGIANRGRGSVSADGTFKFTGKGLDGNPAFFNGKVAGNRGSGTFRHPKCQGTFTMVRDLS